MGTLEASYLMMLGGVVPGGKILSRRLRDGGDLRQRQFDLGVGLEVDARHGDAAIGLRFDVLDVVDGGGHGALEDGDHALFHLVGREAGIVPDDADDGDIDVRKDIHRHRNDGGDAKNGDQQRHDDEGIGAPEGESDYPHRNFRGLKGLSNMIFERASGLDDAL